MCGIAGGVGPNIDEGALRRMCSSIHHRGPDDGAVWTAPGVGLGMRRLAIIDVAHGQQPIWNEDRTIAIVFNGEIYNFAELRQRLVAAGHAFRTQSDTECIVHLYEEHGDSCVDHLRGMFAFAVWDSRTRRLLLARDRVGKKPLAYWFDGSTLWFGSELKALLQVPGFVRDLDRTALHHYLTYGAVPAPSTIYEGVRRLPPASVLTFENGRISVSRYWELDYEPKRRESEDELADELWDRVLDCTRIRLVAERPIGAFLSGGVDSSLVVAAMAQQMTSKVKTFTIGFEDDAFDERPYARAVADHLGTDHHELVVSAPTPELVYSLVKSYDEPFADSSSIPSYHVAKFAREQLVVALNGDGGDESFAGYVRYNTNLRYQRWRLGGALGVPAAKLGAMLAGGRGGRVADKSRAVLRVMAADQRSLYPETLAYFTNADKHDLYTPEMRQATADANSYDLMWRDYSHGAGRETLDRSLWSDVAMYLPDDLLVKMDIATMANSLEARSPLLDHTLMEFAASLPTAMKLKGGTAKHLLKIVARRHVPPHVVDRTKQGFSVPMARWLRGGLRDMARGLLTDGVAQRRGLFKHEPIVRLLEEHDRGADRSYKLWCLIQVELWHRAFIDSPVPAFGT